MHAIPSTFYLLPSTLYPATHCFDYKNPVFIFIFRDHQSLTALKKLFPGFLILCCLVSNVHGQTKSKWSIGAAFGIASPSGKFGNTDIFDSTSAFATTGLAFNVDAVYKLNKHIGFSLLFTGQQNIVDTKTMVNKIEKAVPGAFFNIKSGDWNIGKIMGGINLSVPLDQNEKITAFVRLMAGVMKTTLPKITITEVYYSDSLGNAAVSQSSYAKKSLDWTFAWLAGVGIQYNLSKNYFLHASIDYSASSPKVPYYPVGTRIGATGFYPISGSPYPTMLLGASSSPTYKQPINSFNMCAGIGIRF